MSVQSIFEILAVPLATLILVLIRFAWTEAKAASKDVQELRVTVARDYVQTASLKTFEDRILAALQRVEDRVTKTHD